MCEKCLLFIKLVLNYIHFEGDLMNYNTIFEELLAKQTLKTSPPKLLLHACCAPCSSSVLERLSAAFEVTMLFYNPNITSDREYQKRKEELQHFLRVAYKNISILDCDYDKMSFLAITKGLEKEKEGGKRCYQCYQMRLLKTAQLAKEKGYDYFGTTLSISPYKNSQWLNEIGQSLEEQLGISYLYADFKKKGGYQRSLVLSKKYQLYRQDYCGCLYSKIERRKQRENHKPVNHS